MTNQQRIMVYSSSYFTSFADIINIELNIIQFGDSASQVQLSSLSLKHLLHLHSSPYILVIWAI